MARNRTVAIDMEGVSPYLTRFGSRIPTLGFDLVLWDLNGVQAAQRDWLYRMEDFAEAREDGSRIAVFGYRQLFSEVHMDPVLGLEDLLGVVPKRSPEELTVSTVEAAHPLFGELAPPAGWRWNSIERVDVEGDVTVLLNAWPSGKAVGVAVHQDGLPPVFLLPSLTRELADASLEPLVSALLRYGTYDKEPVPDWADAHLLRGEAAIADAIKDGQRKRDEIAVDLDRLSLQRAEFEEWKELIYATGTQLQNAVARAFHLLGFKSLAADPELADHRWDYGEMRVVAETKGKEGDIGKRDARQLQDWVSTEAKDLQEAAEARGEDPNDVDDPKGVFVANGRRKTPLDQRGNPYHSNSASWMQRFGYCLISGRQLLEIVEIVRHDEGRAKEFADAIVATSGLFQHDDICAP